MGNASARGADFYWKWNKDDVYIDNQRPQPEQIIDLCNLSTSLKQTMVRICEDLPWPSPAALGRFFPRPHPSPDALPARNRNRKQLFHRQQ